MAIYQYLTALLWATSAQATALLSASLSTRRNAKLHDKTLNITSECESPLIVTKKTIGPRHTQVNCESVMPADRGGSPNHGIPTTPNGFHKKCVSSANRASAMMTPKAINFKVLGKSHFFRQLNRPFCRSFRREEFGTRRCTLPNSPIRNLRIIKGPHSCIEAFA